MMRKKAEAAEKIEKNIQQDFRSFWREIFLMRIFFGKLETVIRSLNSFNDILVRSEMREFNKLIKYWPNWLP